MNIGEYQLQSIETGRFRLDGGAMFGVVPYPLWSAVAKPDEKHRITLAARCLLIRSTSRKILVDVGNGNKYSDKLRRIYDFSETPSNLVDSLSAAGVGTGDVTDVILTHLHFDHAGGSTIVSDGKIVPTFPRAKYYVQREHFEWAKQPTEKDRASFFEHDYLPLVESGQLILIDGDVELFSGISVERCYGHTAALQIVRISDGSTTLVYCCDLIPTSAHLPIPYVMAYDLRPLETIREKKLLLAQAAAKNWVLFFEHDPDVVAITVRKGEKGYAVDEKLTL